MENSVYLLYKYYIELNHNFHEKVLQYSCKEGKFFFCEHDNKLFWVYLKIIIKKISCSR